MKKFDPRRLLSMLLAIVMVLGMLPTGLAVSPGDDGTPEMNEALVNRETLAPIGASFNIDTLLEWTPESDPDAVYSRASIPLADRAKGEIQVNYLANPDAKLMLCAMPNSDHDDASAQGSDSFFTYAFNYWQYADSFIYWTGSDEGIVCCPTGEYIDAAHTNGVPIVATLGFPWGSGYGYAEQVDRFCQKAEDGSFPVADKLIEVMDYYGFDGYFFNQESYGCSQATATRLNEMMRYMHAKRPDMLISWYDSMITSGGVSYQDAVNSYNKSWMEPNEDGIWGVDEFFMNYNWSSSKIATTISTMKSIGRSQFDAFAGFNVQANVYGDRLQDHLLVDEDGIAKLSLALYYVNQTITMAKDGEDFHKTEQAYYVNSKGDPRDTSANLNSSAWAGMSRFFAEKTPITSAPFVTNFNTGHGKAWFVDGEKLRDTAWSYQSAQDVLPTYTWIIDSTGDKLEGSYDFADAYNGGSSVKFSGNLNAANEILLYATDVEITNGMTLSLTAKGGLENASVFAYVGDGSVSSYDECEKVSGTLNTGDGWVTTEFDFSPLAGMKIYGLGLEIEGNVADYQINLGRMTIIDKNRPASAAPAKVVLEDILYRDAYAAEARISWSQVTGASSYEIYKVNADGTKTFIMETPNTAYYIPNLVRNADEADVTIEIVALNRNGKRGTAAELTIDWAYGNDDTERAVATESVNVCLGATVTGYSEQGDGAECDKALDGISGNSSKWWASGRGDWFSIDLGAPKTIKRIRMEHAEFGGEGKELNTSAYTVAYKDASGNWVTALKVTGNTDAYNDLLLDTPVTAQEWKLTIDGIGPSPWSAVNIYEWQMFETGFAATENIPMQYATADNGAGAADTFTLKNVPASRTVKVYTAAGTLIGEKSGSGTVTLTGLDFGTAEAGLVYYTVTETGYAESIKLCAKFDAEDAAVSEPAEDVSFAQFSQPGSVSSSRFDEIYTTMTVKGLAQGDVVYVQGRASMPVAEGATSVSIDRVLVKRAGGEIALQVKRAGKLISEVYTVATPAFAEPTATVQVFAENENGETLTGVRFDVVDANGETAAQMSTTSDSGAKATVALGTYTIRNTEVPEGYDLTADTKAILRIEGEQKVLTVVIPTAGEEPEPTDPVEPTDPTDPTDPPVVVDPADDSRDIPLEVLTVSTGNFEPNGGASEGPAELAVDNNTNTIWHTDWYGTSRDDHWFQFELSADYNVDGLRILPRQTGNTNGIITRYDIQVSEDGETWKSVATGNWEADREWKLVSFGAEHVKYVRMYALDGVTDNAYVFASAAEIRITGEEWVAPPEEWNLGLESKIIAYNGTKLGDEEAGPEKLFNGSWSNENTDKWCEDGKDLWVAFDVGALADISSISIYHAGANNEWMPAGASTNTEAYELYVLNTAEISVDELLSMSFQARTDVLGDSRCWTSIATVTGNSDDITTHELDLSDVRIFKFNVSDTDSTNWAPCVRVYEIEVMGALTGNGGGTTPEPGAADKSALNALIELCEMYEKGNYTDESWNAFQAALTAAKAVAADAGATQAAVDAAREALTVALVSLEEKGEEPEEPGVQKILHLDSGRTLYSKDWIVALLNEMSAAGYTHLQLAFGNDGLRFVLDDMTIEANGKTYASDDVKAGIELGNENYNNTHSTNVNDAFCSGADFERNALTEAEMDEIIAHAKSVGIEIIPHVNMPGHMDALLDAIEYLGIADAHFEGYTKSDRSLNLNSAEAVAFTQALLAKYADYFAENGSAYFHIGADEYANDAYSGNMGFPAMGATLYAKFAEFVNQNAAIVKDRGMTPRAWNDGIRYTRYSAEFDTDIEITYWSSGWWGYDVAKPAKFAELGHGLINTHGDYYYILGVNDKFTPGDTAEHDPSLYTEAASYDINTFMGGTVENPVGGMFCIWGDHPFGESEQEVAENIRLILRAMALRMDGKTLDGMDTTVVEGGFNEDGTINGAEQPHEHAFGEWTVTTEPTCTEKGLEERKCECGETETREIDALGHTAAEAVRENEVAPTCTENGSYDSVVYCAVCNEEISRETVTIDALGHDFVNGECQRCDAVMDTAFEDVPVGAFYFDPVQWAVDNGITTGTAPTTFDPEGQCMRAVVVTFLWRAAGEPEPTSANNPFKDVKESDFYYKAVLWAVEEGITNGLTADTFGPTALCNRAQVVTFLWRAMGEPASDTAVSFTDVEEGKFYTTAVAWAVEKGITNGISATAFGVDGICNRAQVVTFLYRAYNK